MRVPPVEGRRRPFGLRGWLIGAAVVLVILLLSLRGPRALLHRLPLVQGRRLRAHVARAARRPRLVPGADLLGRLLRADARRTSSSPTASRRATAATGPEDEIIERYRSVRRARTRAASASRVVAVLRDRDGQRRLVGVAATGSCSRTRRKFGVKDPQFHKDIGFYVFRLPFLQFVAGWMFAALLVVLIVTAVFHYLNGGIRLQSPFQRVTPQVKVHLSVILALMALTKTVQYYLARSRSCSRTAASSTARPTPTCRRSCPRSTC